MKPIYSHLCGALTLSLTLAACVPAPDSTPTPTPAPSPAPATPSPTPVPATPQDSANWIDQPRTPGTWRLSGKEAAYVEADARGTAASRGNPLFILECRGNAVRLASRTASRGVASLTIRTETATRTLQMTPLAGTAPTGFGFVDLQPHDPLLDAMAVTRGRFAVETSGLPALYLPPWAEVTRVIEDCR